MLNILAVLRAYKGSRGSLLHPVCDVFFADIDRIYTRAKPDLYAMVAALAASPDRPFYYEGKPKAALHRRLLVRAAERYGVDPAGYKLRSYRAEGRPSLQVVFGLPRSEQAQHFVEMDLDRGNPLQDVAGFLIHLGEVLDPRRTNHFKLRKKLAKRKARRYLYYTISKP